jgi:hypothetical protein
VERRHAARAPPPLRVRGLCDLRTQFLPERSSLLYNSPALGRLGDYWYGSMRRETCGARA